jgi:hypothetical protein
MNDPAARGAGAQKSPSRLLVAAPPLKALKMELLFPYDLCVGECEKKINKEKKRSDQKSNRNCSTCWNLVACVMNGIHQPAGMPFGKVHL